MIRRIAAALLLSLPAIAPCLLPAAALAQTAAAVTEIDAILRAAADERARDAALYGNLAGGHVLAAKQRQLDFRVQRELDAVVAREGALNRAAGEQAVAYIARIVPLFQQQAAAPPPVAAPMPPQTPALNWYNQPVAAGYGPPATLVAAVPAQRPEPADAADGLSDPLEPLNRIVFAFNEVVDTFLLRPAAWLFSFAPDPAKQGVRNALLNLRAPVTLLNNILQGDFDKGITTVGRFAVNSTLGVAGLWDAAEDVLDMPGQPADFGQTLHGYGIGNGPFVMLPVFGPYNLRDAVGLGVDAATDPWNYIFPDAATIARGVATGVSRREELLVPLDELRRGSVDYYASLRTASQQRRDAFLKGGAAAAPASQKSTDDLFNQSQ